MEKIEHIESEGCLLAIVIPRDYNPSDAEFVSQKEDPFQVGLHNRKQGYRYRAHFSLPFDKMNSFNPNKIYYVKEGTILVDLYNDDRKLVKKVELNAGDLIIFISGGHGVDIIKDAKFIEIKQGPYRGTEKDKVFIE